MNEVVRRSSVLCEDPTPPELVNGCDDSVRRQVTGLGEQLK